MGSFRGAIWRMTEERTGLKTCPYSWLRNSSMACGADDTSKSSYTRRCTATRGLKSRRYNYFPQQRGSALCTRGARWFVVRRGWHYADRT